MANIIFGPVNSRRFGLSLGVDLSPFEKICNFDCVYCELAPKKPISSQTKSIAPQIIIDELKKVLETGVKFDVLTLTANGEPSLYPHLKELVAELKKLSLKQKILILSNGSSVLDTAKFETLKDIDIVKFSLDSAISKSFYRIDKALKSINLSLMIEKMAEFSAQFKGELVMETLVVAGINDSEAEFIALNEAFDKIKPLRVDLSTLDRPPAYAVKAVSKQRLEELSRLITAVPVLLPSRDFKQNRLDLSEEELLKMLHLRAQSEFDIKNLSTNSQKLLENLLKKSAIKELFLAGVKFYKAL